MANLILEFVEGEHAGRQVELLRAVEAGRDASMALTLDDDQVSRRHARFSPSGVGAVIEDLGSTNGTYVNDQPIHGPRQLSPGDRVRLGLTVLELRTPAEVAAQPSVARPVPAVTAVAQGVLQPVPSSELPASGAAPAGIPTLLVEETEPAFVPRAVRDDPEAMSDYAALASLVDARVKHRTNIAAFAVLAVAALAVLIFFGVR